MKKTKLFGLTALLLSLGISGCFGPASTEKKNDSNTSEGDDPDDKVVEGSYMGVNDGHYKVDSKGNRLGKLEDHVLVESEGDSAHTPVPATCALPGRGYKKCTVCGRFVDYTIPKLDHNYQPSSDPAKAATCTRAGLEECTMCKATRETGKPLGHSFGAGEALTIEGATDAAVKKCTCSVCNVDEYVIDVNTANMQLASGSAWKTDPSTGAFKLNSDGHSASFTFKLPAGGKFKMYERAYMDAYKNNYEKKAFYATDNVCNIEVKINDNVLDMSAQSNTIFSDILGNSADDIAKDNSDVKDVLLGEVTLAADNKIVYKRVKTLNMIVSAFIFEPVAE